MAVVVRTTRHHLVDVFQRRCLDADDHVALARFWIREFLEVRWFSKRPQYGSFHRNLIFFFTVIAIKTRTARWQRPNGWRVSGSRRAEGDERVRCTRLLGRLPTVTSTRPYPRRRNSRQQESSQRVQRRS